ncbi:MAG TPA: hypothetical protein VGG39_20385 [Polyangiaceae bacterium]
MRRLALRPRASRNVAALSFGRSGKDDDPSGQLLEPSGYPDE